ncbi:glucuronyl hydrolase [Pedobacter yulinensis]|uniref:Glucuronyl hydrolase n=1 Tax=Pedobacter yulinensis TaxID=2126353 RepID=A0A2T3HMB3_9SPHI|nr:glycoside hydrolase family 88 protein [Pedobacter yulinensis]PST83580.1 glucuronyl hydrolase [Pedobacter yulinensis]
MKRSGNAFLVIFFALFVAGCSARLLPEQHNRLQSVFKEAAVQYRTLASATPDGRFPKAITPGGRLETSGSGWWCSGFYPGTLLYLYEQTKDKWLEAEALRRLKTLEKEQYNTSTHDLGFMMYCSFGNAYRLDPKPEYRAILLNSARSLATRFNAQVGCIKSWDSRNPSDFLVIIDNMMNLELLFWATRVSGDSSFHKIAITHANTTMKHHFRSDNSSYHVVNYDINTGKPRRKHTAQGAADHSAWSRGQAWGLYGFTVMYRETGDKKYLDQAAAIAGFMLNHKNLPADKVPYWDFNAPGIPNALRDASAGAITASALLELADYLPDARNSYRQTAAQILKTLSGPEYRATAGSNAGFLLKHSVGSLPGKSEVDVPLSYADYYFIEACKRQKKR